jgi:hypothetical protein
MRCQISPFYWDFSQLCPFDELRCHECAGLFHQLERSEINIDSKMDPSAQHQSEGIFIQFELRNIIYF